MIVPVYVSGDKPEGFTEIVSKPGAVENVSHGALEAADHVNVPPPEFETTTFFGAGPVPPTVYKN